MWPVPRARGKAAAWSRISSVGTLRSTVERPENLSRHHAAAASNGNMTNQLEAILPSSHLELIPRENQVIQTHTCGTMLEACVSYVHDAGDNAAVAELARYLLDSSIPSSPLKLPNPKGKLLELGGSVDIVKVSGSDHQPIWLGSVAKLPSQTDPPRKEQRRTPPWLC